jgi:hypothetical protein
MKEALLRWQVETADIIPTTVDPRSPEVHCRFPAVTGSRR